MKSLSDPETLTLAVKLQNRERPIARFGAEASMEKRRENLTRSYSKKTASEGMALLKLVEVESSFPSHCPNTLGF